MKEIKWVNPDGSKPVARCEVCGETDENKLHVGNEDGWAVVHCEKHLEEGRLYGGIENLYEED